MTSVLQSKFSGPTSKVITNGGRLLARTLAVSLAMVGFIGPSSLWAGARASNKLPSKHQNEPSTEKKIDPIAQAQGQWKDFNDLLAQYKVQEPTKSLSFVQTYIQRWPSSPLLDSVKLIAAQCAMQIKQYSLAYEFCDHLQDSNLRQRVLDLRLQLLCQAGRYGDAERLFLKEFNENLAPEQKATCEFYMAQALYKPLQLDPTVFGLSSNEKKILRESQKKRIEQATNYYQSSAALIGAEALVGLGECQQWLGMGKEAAKNYIEASESPNSDRSRLLYLAALSLRDADPRQALEISEKASNIGGNWRGASAFLWVEIASHEKMYKQLLDSQELITAAQDYQPYETLWMVAQAHHQLNQNEHEIQVLTNLLTRAFGDRQVVGTALVQQAFQALGECLIKSAQPLVLEQWLQRYNLACGRDHTYFSMNFVLAQLYDQENNAEGALKAYSRIVVQCPTFEKIGYCLLRKGVLESALNMPVAAWSTLDLYLREHATVQDLTIALPVYLQLSVDLRDYPASKGLNIHRFGMVLDRLANAPISENELQEMVLNQARNMDVAGKWSQAQNFLRTAQLRHPKLLNPASELLMFSCQVQVDQNFDTYFAKASELFSRITDESQRIKLQLTFVDRLNALTSAYPQGKAQLDEQALASLSEIFDKEPNLLDSSRLLSLYHLQRARLVLQKSPSPWDLYFPGAMYRFDLNQFEQPVIASDARVILDRLSRLGHLLKERQGNIDELMALDLAHLAWLDGDIQTCVQLIPTTTLPEVIDECRRLALICAWSQQTHDITKYWEAGMQLLELMKNTKAPVEVRLNFEMALAKETAARARLVAQAASVQRPNTSSKSKSTNAPTAAINWKERALNLFADIDNQRRPETEPLHLEAAIEKARLMAWSPDCGENCQLLENELIAVKKRYMESSEGLESYKEQMLSQDLRRNVYHAYIVLMDAMLAQDEALLDQRQMTSSEDPRLKLEVARNLYSTLQKDHYLLTAYLDKRVQEGLQQVEHLEKEME